MQSVCLECHNTNFIGDFYTAADAATERVNEWVRESDEIMQPLKDRGLLTPAPFDEPIDFVYFEVWHHWGRTAKFGSWMQGADYVQWHGAYELLSDLAELREMVADRLEGARWPDPNSTTSFRHRSCGGAGGRSAGTRSCCSWLPYSKTRAYLLMVGMGILAALVSSVLDHARTGFDTGWVWLPTGVAVFALVSSVALGLHPRPTNADMVTFIVAMLALTAIGPIGSWLHMEQILVGQNTIVIERFLRGPPFLAPLLYSNMGLLGLAILIEPERRECRSRLRV